MTSITFARIALTVLLGVSAAACKQTAASDRAAGVARITEERAAQAASDKAAAEARITEERAAQARIIKEIAQERRRAIAEPAPVPSSSWTYGEIPDPMTSTSHRVSLIPSDNAVSFGFPYEGEQHATLAIRSGPPVVRLTIEQGQFMCPPYQGCRVLVRFDDDPAKYWEAGGPADHSTTSIFIENEQHFVRRLRTAKSVRIQTNIYQNGSPVFEFSVAGFDPESAGLK